MNVRSTIFDGNYLQIILAWLQNSVKGFIDIAHMSAVKLKLTSKRVPSRIMPIYLLDFFVVFVKDLFGMLLVLHILD
jgi:hypothetical protein